MVGSCNAYMLMYTAKNRKLAEHLNVPEKLKKSVETETNLLLEQIREYENLYNAEKIRLGSFNQLVSMVIKPVPADFQVHFLPQRKDV